MGGARPHCVRARLGGEQHPARVRCRTAWCTAGDVDARAARRLAVRTVMFPLAHGCEACVPTLDERTEEGPRPRPGEIDHTRATERCLARTGMWIAVLVRRCPAQRGGRREREWWAAGMSLSAALCRACCSRRRDVVLDDRDMDGRTRAMFVYAGRDAPTSLLRVVGVTREETKAVVPFWMELGGLIERSSLSPVTVSAITGRRLSTSRPRLAHCRAVLAPRR